MIATLVIPNVRAVKIRCHFVKFRLQPPNEKIGSPTAPEVAATQGDQHFGCNRKSYRRNSRLTVPLILTPCFLSFVMQIFHLHCKNTNLSSCLVEMLYTNVLRCTKYIEM